MNSVDTFESALRVLVLSIAGFAVGLIFSVIVNYMQLARVAKGDRRYIPYHILLVGIGVSSLIIHVTVIVYQRLIANAPLTFHAPFALLEVIIVSTSILLIGISVNKKGPSGTFEMFWDQAPDLLVIANEKGYFEKVSPSWLYVLGWTEAEMISRPYLEFVHPEDRDATVLEAKSMGSRATLEFENRYLHKFGGYVRLQWRTTGWHEGKTFAVAREVGE